MILIRQEDGPFTVPVGKALVITGLGADFVANNCLADLLVDGLLVTQAGITSFNSPGGGFYSGSSIHATQSIRVDAGATVTANVSCSPAVRGRATGYLVSARP